MIMTETFFRRFDPYLRLISLDDDVIAKINPVDDSLPLNTPGMSILLSKDESGGVQVYGAGISYSLYRDETVNLDVGIGLGAPGNLFTTEYRFDFVDTTYRFGMYFPEEAFKLIVREFGNNEVTRVVVKNDFINTLPTVSHSGDNRNIILSFYQIEGVATCDFKYYNPETEKWEHTMFTT